MEKISQFKPVGGAQAQGGNPMDALKGLWASIPEQYRPMIIRGLIGAGVGGGALGLSRLFSGKDEEDSGGVIRQALLGMLLGAGAGTASTMLPEWLSSPHTYQPRVKSESVGGGETLTRHSGAPIGAAAWHAAVGRRGKSLDKRILDLSTELQAGKTMTPETAKAVREEVSRYRGRVRGTGPGAAKRNLYNSSETMAYLDNAPWFERLRNSRAGKAMNLKKRVPRNMSKSMLHQAVNRLDPRLGDLKPRRLGRGANLAGYIGSAIGGHYLSRKAVDHFMDR